MAKKGIIPEDEAVKKQQDADWAATKGKRTNADYDKRYAELQSRYGIATPEKSDFRKDMDEYGPRIKVAMNKTKEANKTARIKDTSRPAREEQSMKSLKDYETKVKTSNGGYAEAETKEKPQTTKRRRTTVTKDKQPPAATSTKQKPQTSNTTEATSDTKSVPPPKKGYEPENQDVNKINGNAVKTMLYNDRVKLGIQSKRPKKRLFSPTKLTVSSLRNEYQRDLIKKHKKEMSK